ncbi:ankyrin-1-like [Sitodiplosis mosellana]|uniref:ankyrin-1-like n=1 Tax=Sitodiplosis mosellana TaxID=263140 RepID=UPI002443E442|nr:ankyrin-1-like [Sitodiplosis mosellana]
MLPRAGTNINLKTDLGWTPLHSMVISKAIILMVRQSEEFNEINAYVIGHYGIVTMLIQKGADVNLKTNDGWIPLHASSYNSHFKVIEALAKNGASIDITDKNGKIPIYIATGRSHKKVVEVLNKIVADRNAQTDENSGNDFAATKNGD